MFFPPNETLSKHSLLEVVFDLQVSAGPGSGVLVRMFRLTIIGHGGGHAGAVGTGGHRDIAAGGSTHRAGTSPALHAMPSTIAALLLELYLD